MKQEPTAANSDKWKAAQNTIARHKEAERCIQVNNRPLREVSHQLAKVIIWAAEGRLLYNRSGHLTAVVTGETGITLEVVTKPWLRGLATRLADFVKVEKERRVVHVDPRDQIVEDHLTYGLSCYPPLRGITHTPYFRKDASFVSWPGYNRVAKIFYQPLPGFTFPHLHRNPSPVAVRKAKRLLFDELLCDFPFKDPASCAVIVAALLTIVARPMIEGTVPLIIISAPQAGTGKGLLANISSLITTGDLAHITPPAKSEEEWRKRILSLLIQGNALIVFDNIVGALESPSLAAMLTSEIFQDRLLGRAQKLSASRIWPCAWQRAIT